jgi:acyl dehydratase
VSGLPIGTFEDAVAMLGYRTEPATAEVPVELGLVKALAGLVEDGSPTCWSAEFANQHWGGRVAPPSALICLFTALHWQPGGKRDTSLLCTKVPLPGPTLINTSTDTRFHAPLWVGDWITMIEEFTALSESPGDLGARDGPAVHRHRGRYGPARDHAAADLTTIAAQPAGTRDFSPWHHDPAAARDQGQRTIYANTMFLEAFLDRTALGWAGPTWFLTRRQMRILASAYAGCTLVGTGQVEHVESGPEGGCVEVSLRATTEDGVCATARITLQDRIPTRAEGPRR